MKTLSKKDAEVLDQLVDSFYINASIKFDHITNPLFTKILKDIAAFRGKLHKELDKLNAYD